MTLIYFSKPDEIWLHPPLTLVAGIHSSPLPSSRCTLNQEKVSCLSIQHSCHRSILKVHFKTKGSIPPAGQTPRPFTMPKMHLLELSTPTHCPHAAPSDVWRPLEALHRHCTGLSIHTDVTPFPLLGVIPPISTPHFQASEHLSALWEVGSFQNEPP